MSEGNPSEAKSSQPVNNPRRGFLKTAGAAAAGLVVGGVAVSAGGMLLGSNTLKSPSSGFKQGNGALTIGTSVTTTGPIAPAIAHEIDMFNAWATMMNNRGGIYVPDRGGYIPIRMVVYPDNGQFDPGTIKANYVKLATQDKVDVLIGPFTDVASLAAIPVAVQYGIPYVDNQADSVATFTVPDPGHWVVGSLNLINFFVWNYLNLLKATTSAKTVAFIDTGDDFTTEVNGVGPSQFGGKQFAQQLGLNVVANAHVNTNYAANYDYTKDVLQMKSLDPDVVIFSDNSGIFAANFWLTCKTQNYKPRAFHPILGSYQAFQATVGSAMGNGISADVLWDPALPYQGLWGKRFWEQVQTAAGFSFASVPANAYGFTCLEIITAAVQFAGSTDKATVRDAMNSMEFMNIQGPWKIQDPITYPFPPPQSLNVGHGASLTISFPVQVINGKTAILWPKDIANGSYQYPQPTSF